MGAFFQELTPENKVTVDENSERHSMTTTYIHNIYPQIMAYNMRHATDLEKIDLGSGKLLEFEKKVPFVLELSWNFVNSSLKM